MLDVEEICARRVFTEKGGGGGDGGAGGNATHAHNLVLLSRAL